jgi:hypothetical protein
VGLAFLASLILIILPQLPALSRYNGTVQFLHEVGFALLVAIFVWSIFEVFSQAQTEDYWNDRIEKITRNVFFGVFRRNFPDGLIKEANILLLDHTFLRKGLDVTYTLMDGSYVDRDGVAQTFVKLSAITRFRIINISNIDAEYPIGVGLPNPLIEEMKSFCKVNRIYVRRGEKTEYFDLDEAEKTFREEIKDDDIYQVNFKLKPIKIASGEEVEFVSDYIMAKEEEDTELLQTKFPTDSLSVTIMDQGPTNRMVRARSIHLGDLRDDTPKEANGSYNFTLDRYLLPHQGFVIWWKKRPSRGIPNPVTSVNEKEPITENG